MTFDKIYQYAFLLLSALWIPFPKLGGIAIALFACVVIFGVFKQKLKFQLHPVFIGFVLLYALYALTILTGTDIHKDLPQLEYKLSLVIFPILFSFKPVQGLERKKVLDTFVCACVLLGVLYLGNAIFSFIQTGETQNFHSSWFAFNHHPSYAAAFFSLAIFYLLSTMETLKLKHKIGAISIVSFLSLLHFPLESMAGILILVGVYFFFFIKWSVKRLSKKLIFIIGLSCAIFIFGFLRFQPGLGTDFKNTVQSSISFVTNPQQFIQNCPQKMSGNQARLILWTISGEIIAQHPFGIGMSGLDSELSKKLHHLGFHEIAAKHWNPHNQFLQLTAELGWFALLLLLGTILFLVKIAWQRKDLIFGFMIASFVINSLFESMLQRQSGIVFYLLFLSAFISIINPPKQIKA